jgi:glucose/arabinose dehydrogenase
VWAKGQGGLLDIRTLPHDPKQIFITYTQNSPQGGTTALLTARLQGSTLTQSNTLLITGAYSTDTIHFGSRIEFDGKDHLWITVGDRNQREKVQKLDTHYGKILHLKWTDSSPQPEVWSRGHRSPQGLVWDSVRKVLFESEMGPRGGDEINQIQKGSNYGWPEVTWGREYHGPKIGVTEKPGITQPLLYWAPSISPSGMTVVRNSKFKDWEGDLLVATLSGEHLRRLVLDSKLKVTQQIEYFQDLGERFRCVRIGPDGRVYFSTDSGKIGRILEVTP